MQVCLKLLNGYLLCSCAIFIVTGCGVVAKAPLTRDEQHAAEQKQDAEQSARDQKKLQSLAEAQAGINHVRSFTIKVVDQDGNPVAGVKIGGFAKKYVRWVMPSGKMFDAIDIAVLTDVQGMAKTAPVEGGEFWLNVYGNDLPVGYDCDDSQNIIFVGNEPSLATRGDVTDQSHKIPGVDWIFTVHRCLGPHPLVEFQRNVKDIALDGTSFAWPVIHPRYQLANAAKGIDAKAGPFTDFKVRFWFDPQALKTVDYPEKMVMENGVQKRLINGDAAWWLEIEAVRGGLLSIDPSKKDIPRESLAPETGYVNRILWAKSSEPLTLRSSPSRTFWWRRSGVPTRYARIQFTIYSKLDYATQQHLVVSLEAGVIANPAPEDRLIELPMRRKPIWITDLTEQFAMSWLAEPVGDPDPTIRQVEPQLVPAPNK